MLASHERSLVAALGHSEPAGQIAAREMEIVRIKGALHRAEELSDDVAAAIDGLSEGGQLSTCRHQRTDAVDEVTMVRARLLNHARDQVDER